MASEHDWHGHAGAALRHEQAAAAHKAAMAAPFDQRLPGAAMRASGVADQASQRVDVAHRANLYRLDPARCRWPCRYPRSVQYFDAATAALAGEASMKDSVTVGDVAARTPTLDIACSRCSRRGRLSMARMMRVLGPEAPISDAWKNLNRDCPQRVAQAIGGRCDLHAPELPALFGR